MSRMLKVSVAAAALAGVGLWVAQSASAQWGYHAGPTYFHAPYTGPGFSYGYSASRYSLYAPVAAPYDYAPPAYGYPAAPAVSAPLAPSLPGYGPVLGRPHGKLEYDVYNPYGGRSEVNYRFRRDGSVRVDYDD